MPAVPRTLSGKKLEVPVKRILLGQPAEDVASKDALADPTALDWYRACAQSTGLRARRGLVRDLVAAAPVGCADPAGQLEQDPVGVLEVHRADEHVVGDAPR